MSAVAFPLDQISYMTEPVESFTKELDAADSLDALKQFALRWKSLAPDAEQIVSSMTDADFTEFRAGLRKERRGKFAGEPFLARYGNVLMPDVLFSVTGHAAQFGAPWGLVYTRMRDAGHIVERDGCASLK